MKKHGLEAWQMMREAKDCIGMSAMERIFHVGHKSLYKQMKNPDYAGESKRPVIQRVRMLLHDLENAGGEELAHAMLDYMAAPLGMHVVSNANATPDAASLRAECLDDYPPLVELHKLIEDKAGVRAIQAQAEEAKREIDETVTAYRLKLEGRGND